MRPRRGMGGLPTPILTLALEKILGRYGYTLI